jgi:hypothetical protein
MTGRTFGIVVALSALAALTGARAWAQDGAAGVLADQIRLQGHACQKPLEATRDASASKPDEAVWILKCEGGVTYRIRLVPDQAAKIEKIAG